MPIKTSNRSWDFPAKDDPFDISYDLLLSFLNTLDSEFSNVMYFMFGRNIKYLFKSQLEIDSTIGNQDDLAVFLETGEILVYDTLTGWSSTQSISKLPTIHNINPSITDKNGFSVGSTWVNIKSGQIFKFKGLYTILINGSEQIQPIWVDQFGEIPFRNDIIRKITFLPYINFEYKTKTKIINNGEESWDDDLIHNEGIIRDNNLFIYDNDTHVELYINGQYFSRIKLEEKSNYSFIDFEYFNPEGGLPIQNSVEINPWIKKFSNLLYFIEISSEKTENKRYFKKHLIHNYSLEDIVDSNILETFKTYNNLISIDQSILEENKVEYRNYFITKNETELSIEEKKKAIYLLIDEAEIGFELEIKAYKGFFVAPFINTFKIYENIDVFDETHNYIGNDYLEIERIGGDDIYDIWKIYSYYKIYDFSFFGALGTVPRDQHFNDKIVSVKIKLSSDIQSLNSIFGHPTSPMPNIKEVIFENSCNLERVKDCFGTFSGLSEVEILNIENMNLSDVVSTLYMFSYTSINSLNPVHISFSGFNNLLYLSNVEGMFLHSNVIFSDSENLDTSKVDNFKQMFNYYKPQQHLDISGLSFNNAGNMESMFEEALCTSIEFPTSILNYPPVASMFKMFKNTTNLLCVNLFSTLYSMNLSEIVLGSSLSDPGQLNLYIKESYINQNNCP